MILSPNILGPESMILELEFHTYSSFRMPDHDLGSTSYSLCPYYFDLEPGSGIEKVVMSVSLWSVSL